MTETGQSQNLQSQCSTNPHLPSDLIGEDIFDNFESMFLFDVNIYMIPIQIFDSSINVVSCNPESE